MEKRMHAQKGISSAFDAFMRRKNWSKYAGRWVAICDDKVIADASTLNGVVKESSKKCSGTTPTFTKIPRGSTLFL